MRLSEAIRLGSLAIQKPTACYSQSCAIGMGAMAIGKHSEAGSGWVDSSDSNIRAIVAAWPWTIASGATTLDRYGVTYAAYAGTYIGKICQIFDTKVTDGEMTLEALCDQVKQWEDELAAKGINVEQVTMIATPEATHEPAAEKSEMVGVTEARDHE